jgi:hypothetical protein
VRGGICADGGEELYEYVYIKSELMAGASDRDRTMGVMEEEEEEEEEDTVADSSKREDNVQNGDMDNSKSLPTSDILSHKPTS